jgi:hypothetical protein
MQGSVSATTEQLEEQLVANTEAVEECMAALQVGMWGCSAQENFLWHSCPHSTLPHIFLPQAGNPIKRLHACLSVVLHTVLTRPSNVWHGVG